jgi:hypothetical protein
MDEHNYVIKKLLEWTRISLQWDINYYEITKDALISNEYVFLQFLNFKI